MLKISNCILFVKNVFSTLAGGHRPLWGEMWRLSRAGVRTIRPSAKVMELNKKLPRIIRSVIDESGLAVATSGSIGMAYLVMSGHKSNNPNQDAAAIRILAEMRTAHIRVDTLTLLLIEGWVSATTYRQLHTKMCAEDEKFYQYVQEHYKDVLPKETDRGQLPTLAKRILDGESREVVCQDFVCSIWPSLKTKQQVMEA